MRPEHDTDLRTPHDLDGGGSPPPTMSDPSLQASWGGRVQSVGGVRFVASTPPQAAADLVDAVLAGDAGVHVHLANAYSVALADSSPSLKAQAFDHAAGWNLPDGRPIAWFSRLRRDRPTIVQVRGPQFFLDVCEAGLARGVQHYLLGAAPEVLGLLRSRLEERFPGIRIVGSDSPPFRTPTDAELIARDARIADSGAHIVWVGLGTPKQDVEAARLASTVPAVAIAVGAAFDFAAGTLREAPPWMRAIGLEWLFRFAMEPRRLWRRYVFSNLRFIEAVVRSGRR